jgi:FtsZ-interacting cell division protein ZipA
MISVADGIWVPLANATAASSHMRVALQLADRRGHVTEEELSAFRSLTTQWAESVGATVQAPEIAPYGQISKELDRFCADVDVLIGLNVVAASGDPFSGTKVRSCAEAAGFRLANGVFLMEDPQGAGLFALENMQGDPFDPERLKATTVNGVTLLLDVPRLEQGVKVFDRMIETGRELAISLGGSLVDDNRSAVTEAGLEQIRNQLRHIYAAMEARGIRAGSRVALRLFS